MRVMKRILQGIVALLTLLCIFVEASPPQNELLSAIGRRVWKNECAGTLQGLVSWNVGEDFPSLGIGHFIWYPKGKKGTFDESFPQLVAYAERSGVEVPDFFHGAAPWPNRTAFLADRTGLPGAMRNWLAGHLDVQVQFLAARLQSAFRSILAASRDPRSVHARYTMLSRSAQGLYCLIDYVNFKGDGTKTSERYNGQGWGLLQVLEEMRGTPSSPDEAAAEFSRAAEVVMRRRVKNSPPVRGEVRWLPGWVNRCRTYAPGKR